MSLPDSLPSSSSSAPVAREESGYIRFEHGQNSGFDNRDRPPWNRSEYDYRHGSIVASENVRNGSNSEDPWSCVVVVATFCVFGEIDSYALIYTYHDFSCMCVIVDFGGCL